VIDPFGEKALDVQNMAILRALPLALLGWLARQASHNQSVLGDNGRTLTYTPAEFDGLRALNETQDRD
jgi:hypothetical protein